MGVVVVALEMRVYAELTEIDPKILWGLTGRQLVAAAVGLVVTGGVGAWAWVSGQTRWTSVIVTVLVVPVAAWAWLRPMGLRLEVWGRLVWRYWSRPRRLLYSNEPTWGSGRPVVAAGMMTGRRVRRRGKAPCEAGR